ncbi:type 1 glutamine amidotransferase domain-containing protein [Sinorhizobium mexicanum]|uniref:Type 1 glutamine amidotransferase domain-containing protein n=1 Tax=Sinorhizobium mexicanum TaxID=375549 RepID=A0A859QPK9_9HYPH|nr:type 1 glutamine amidotransferase domain-containing protein [Sinorhizobium mexicanum]MBP1886386.1 putative intracellular protease/amidase [Sinorhizobium mexicanum]QLL64017.1 type 1 glutamine amidotransferase domain-containing protein [Sinorhizobium mexicanum]
MRILMVLTSHDTLSDTGKKTGLWLEEFAAPYYAFLDAGAEITLASPKGGQPPINPKSDTPEGKMPLIERFEADPAAQKALANTLRLSDVNSRDFAAIFRPGGHGPMLNLAEDAKSIKLIEESYNEGKPVSAVCHAPAVPHRVEIDGEPLVGDKRVSAAHVPCFYEVKETAIRELLANKTLTNLVPLKIQAEIAIIGRQDSISRLGDAGNSFIPALRPWEQRCHALIGLLDLHQIVTTKELNQRVNTSIARRADGLSQYERSISAISDVLLDKGILDPSELALAMADVEMRAVCIPAKVDAKRVENPDGTK